MDAAPARAYLRQLAAQGIGLTQAARLSGVPRTTVHDVRRGVSHAMTVAHLDAVLAIPCVPALGALTRAWPTRRLLAWFHLEGFSDAEIARRLGYRSLRTRFSSHSCTVLRAARVRALYRKVSQI